MERKRDREEGVAVEPGVDPAPESKRLHTEPAEASGSASRISNRAQSPARCLLIKWVVGAHCLVEPSTSTLTSFYHPHPHHISSAKLSLSSSA